ncbi:MAG TPA: GNAT family N-acetyltransferase [Lichenihabitans sp.]|nr:GNAT family N-acetyltransferase [Lichenihabitans sp.]
MIIRDAAEADLPGILEIHNDAVANTTAIWSVHQVDIDNRRAFMRDRQGRGFPFLVAADHGAVLGYASFGDFRPHDGYFKTVEHSVYVDRHRRRRGIAAQLMPPLIERARTLGKHAMVGGIDAANEASVRLHESLGFQQVGLLPQVGFKFGRYLDLLFMQKILD